MVRNVTKHYENALIDELLVCDLRVDELANRLSGKDVLDRFGGGMKLMGYLIQNCGIERLEFGVTRPANC